MAAYLEGPVNELLRPAVAALLEDVLDPEGRGLDPGCLHGATDDMLRRIAIMPRWLGVGMAALTLAYDASGGPHHRQPRDRRARRTDRWRRAPGPLKNLVDFYDKMGTFTYYTRVEAAHVGPAAPQGGEGAR